MRRKLYGKLVQIVPAMVDTLKEKIKIEQQMKFVNELSLKLVVVFIFDNKLSSESNLLKIKA